MNKYQEALNSTIKFISELAGVEYKFLKGAKEEKILQELVNKSIPMMIEEAQDYEGKKIYVCSICKTRLHDLTDKYCSNCGHAIEELI